MSLSIPALIEKKRDGHVLSEDDLAFFVKSVITGSMQDSQIGAMLMAIYLNGLTISETMALTHEMTYSGDVVKFPEEWNPLLVDKHSTGGIGDKISLVLAPVLAALGFKVPMVSGRGLGHTGGTLDKLESIPGKAIVKVIMTEIQQKRDLGTKNKSFKIKLTNKEMVDCLETAGCFIAGAAGSFAPADAILYQQRDVTSTVACLPLIVSSIISKKAAEGTKALVMDVKVGKGSFLKTEEEARAISKMLIEVSKGMDISTKVVISRMDQPIGYAIGNAIEVAEAIDSLKGDGSEDVQNLVQTLGGVIMVMKGHVKSLDEGKSAVNNVIQTGAALKHFYAMLIHQGVEESIAKELTFGDPYNVLKIASRVTTLTVPEGGYIADIDALKLGLVCWKLGAGRNKSSDIVDHSVGLSLLVRPGQLVNKGDSWIKVMHASEELDDNLRQQLNGGLTISNHTIIISSPIIDIL